MLGLPLSSNSTVLLEIMVLLILLVSLLLDTSSQILALKKDLACYWESKDNVAVQDSLFVDPLVELMRTSASMNALFSLPWTISG